MRDQAEPPTKKPLPRQSMPIFVIGCHRSGTTLTRYILDTHPAIACPPESKYLSALLPLFGFPRAMEGIRGLGGSFEDIREHVVEFGRAFLDDYAERRDKRRWADKTPNYYRIVELLDYLFNGQVLYLFIVRHPLDVIPSLMDMLRIEVVAGNNEPFLRDLAARHGIGEYGAAKYWVEFNERLWTFSQCTPERVHWIRYEDLVGHTENTLGEMFHFLGEDFDPRLIEDVFRTEHDSGFEYGQIRKRTSIESHRVQKWVDWPEAKRSALWKLVAETAGCFGYSV